MEDEHFDRWFPLCATVVEVGVPVDDEGLLAGSLVEKVHEISYEPGSTVVLALVSPDGETYVRIGHDAGRATGDAADRVEVVEIDVPDGFTTMLPVRVLVIRTGVQGLDPGPGERAVRWWIPLFVGVIVVAACSDDTDATPAPEVGSAVPARDDSGPTPDEPSTPTSGPTTTTPKTVATTDTPPSRTAIR